MKNRNKIDDLFREALSDYRIEPSIGLWRRIERRFFPPSRFSPSGLITSIFLLIIAGSMPWILIPANNQEEKEPNITPENARRGYLIKPANVIHEGTDHGLPAASEKAFSVQPVIFEENPVFTPDDDGTLFIASINDPTDDPSIMPLFINSKDAYTIIRATPADPLQFYSDRWTYRMKPHKPGLMNLEFIIEESLETRNQSLNKAFLNGYENQYVKSADVSYGLNFNPMVVFYDPNPYNKMLGIEAIVQYRISSFNLKTGIGFSRMEDVGTYKIDYTSYDSVGFFLNVVSFEVDPRNPGQFILQLREEAIYDSVPHYTLSEKTNYYNYIDIPMSFGYTFLQKRRVSLTANVGLIFSFMVSKNEPTVDFYVDNGEIIGIERQVPARVPTNWRYAAGVDFGYALTDHLSLHLEPVFEQYISSIYAEQPGYTPKKPFVTGIKAGVLVKF